MASVSQLWVSEDEVGMLLLAIEAAYALEGVTPEELETLRNLRWKLKDIPISCPYRRYE